VLKRKRSSKLFERRMTMDDLMALVDFADGLVIRCDKCGAKWGEGRGKWFFVLPDHGWYHACQCGKGVAKRKPAALTS
jgi:hypothetical protein